MPATASRPVRCRASRLLREFRFRRIAPDAALYAVVGNPIIHSRSPVMHNAGFAALGLNAVYVPLEARDADDFVGLCDAHGCARRRASRRPSRSASCRAPTRSMRSRRASARSTPSTVRGGRWLGANTDVEGFLAPLARRTALDGTRVSVLGSGGAARAVAVALGSRKARVTVCCPQRRRRASDCAAWWTATAGEFPPRPASWDVLVNATPVGSEKTPGTPMGNAPLDGRSCSTWCTRQPTPSCCAPRGPPAARRSAASRC